MARKLAFAGFCLLLLSAFLGDQVRVVPLNSLPNSLVVTDGPGHPSGPMVHLSPGPASVKGQKPASGCPSTVVAAAPRSGAILVKIKELEPAVQKYGSLHGVDEDLVWAIIRHESGFNPRAVSPKGAMGLMQLMPETAVLLGVADPFDAEQNIAGGIKYLEQCLSQFNQDIALALAAYNAGPQNVTKYKGCPPFAETRQYVAAVLQTYAGHPQYRKLTAASSAADEVLALLDKVGLLWQVPLPRCKVAAPQIHVRAPHWKRTRVDIVSLAP
jgi:hypothetical protein